MKGILILEEATSALDNITQFKILENNRVQKRRHREKVMFRREIRVNYGKLEGISDAVSTYLTALDEMERNVDILLQQISEGSGEAYECLVERGSTIKGQINGCREELDGLQTLLCGYSQDMQALIRPCSQYQSMLVDRNDIWANLETIRGLCERFNQLGAGMLVSAPGFPFNPFADQEEREAEEENYRIVEEVRESIQACYRNHIQECMERLDSLYQNHVVEYENKDDEYAGKALDYYKNHTEREDYINHLLGKGLDTCGSFFEGLGNSLFDLLVGIAELGKGVLWFAGAGIPYLVCEAGELDKPDWVKEGVENPIEGIAKALGDPGAVLEGIAQQVTDCSEQKGYAYCTGYGIGSVVGIKGLDKISKVAKVTKATEEVAAGSEVVGEVSGIADVAIGGGSKSLGIDELVTRDSKFLDSNGDIDWEKWAPNGGRVPGTIKEGQTLDVGTVIDRYGNQYGKYTSPVGVPYEQRALPYIENPNAYHQYEVIKPIDNVTMSEIAKAFEQQGGGIQYELPSSIKQLIKDEFIKEIK